MSTTAELLNKAADIIAEKGLNQNGEYFGPDGSCCAFGALNRACDLLAADEPRYTEARALLSYQLWHDHKLRFLAEWNDAPERTADEVITLLRRAAEAVA